MHNKKKIEVKRVKNRAFSHKFIEWNSYRHFKENIRNWTQVI